MQTPTGSRWVSNNYITRCHRRFELVGVRVAVPVGDKMPAWESACRLRASALRTPVEQLNRMRKKCCYSQRNLGSICCRLSPSPTPLSHITNINPFATLSRIKCERYYFLKKCVRSFIEVFIIVDYVSACICIRIVVSWLYNRCSLDLLMLILLQYLEFKLDWTLFWLDYWTLQKMQHFTCNFMQAKKT